METISLSFKLLYYNTKQFPIRCMLCLVVVFSCKTILTYYQLPIGSTIYLSKNSYCLHIYVCYSASNPNSTSNTATYPSFCFRQQCNMANNSALLIEMQTPQPIY